ncbi:hypothetical protein Tco_1352555 [Tanacetum coccineum]
MATLKFADTHNMVAFLSKPTESKGFEQIVDFLNANPIRYALTINPTIYTSCIKQFWATVMVKTVNGEVQLLALVDGKKIIITELTVRRDLQLEDAEGVDCLPNSTIFEQLTLMRYEKISQKLTFYKAFFSPQWKFLIHTILQCLNSKTNAWNEFSSTMASVIICLATNQKFSFSKYIFESMVKNFDNAGKFLMYQRFVQVFLDKQLEGMSNHNRIYVTPSHTKKIFGNMRRAGKGFSGRETPLFQTMGEANVVDEAVNEEMDDSLERVATTATSGEDRLKLNELMALCTNLQQRVLDLETIKTTQAYEIASLKRRVKKLERRNKSRTHRLKRLYKVGLIARVESSGDEEGLGKEDASRQGRKINAIDADEDITLVNDQDDADMFDVNDLDGDEVIVDNVDVVTTVSAASTIPVSSTTTTTTTTPTTIIFVPKPPQDKGKGIMIEEPVVEHVKPMKRLEQIRLDEEISFKLQAEEEEEERLAREKAQQTEEANIAWDDVQAKIEADYQLAQRLQAQEQEELTDEEKGRLFVQFLEQRRKHFAAKRAKEKRICHQQELNKGVSSMKRVNTFVDYRTELVEESSNKAEAEIAQERSSKRAGDKLEQENAKKQKVDEDKEIAELQSLIEVVLDDDEEVAIDAVPLATKPPTIVDLKIHKEGKKIYYQIIRANGKSQMYTVFSQMLKSFCREDLEDLYKLVKAKYGSIRPVEDLDLIL